MVITESKPGAVNLLKALYAGLVATAVMTAFMIVMPLTGMPKMNVGELLGAMVHSAAIGWGFHFIIGIAFAYIYVLFFNDWLPVENHIFRGLMYGVIIFIFSEIIVTLVNISGFLAWHEKEKMAMMIFGNLFAHLFYGIVLGVFITNKSNE